MIRAADVQAKPATPAPVSSAEPDQDEPVTLLLSTLRKGGKYDTFGSITLRERDMELLAECIENFASSRPRTVAKLSTKPPAKYIVVAIEPDVMKRTTRSGESLNLGEVVTTPDLVAFLKLPGCKLNASLVRYYSKEHKPFEYGGYTLRLLEDFLRDLRGPVGRDHQAIAEAHAIWAEENRVEPFQ